MNALNALIFESKLLQSPSLQPRFPCTSQTLQRAFEFGLASPLFHSLPPCIQSNQHLLCAWWERQKISSPQLSRENRTDDLDVDIAKTRFLWSIFESSHHNGHDDDAISITLQCLQLYLAEDVMKLNSRMDPHTISVCISLAHRMHRLSSHIMYLCLAGVLHWTHILSFIISLSVFITNASTPP